MYSATILLLGLLPPAMLFFFSRFGKHSAELNPFFLLGWAILLGYTLKSVYVAWAVTSGATFRTDFLSFDIVPLGQLAVCASMFAFLVGYSVFNGAPIATRYAPFRARAQKRNPEFLYYALFAASVILMAIYFYQMGFFQQLVNLRFVASKFFIDEEGAKSSLGFLTIGGDILIVYFLFYVCFAPKFRVTSPYVISMIFISLCYMLASRRNGVMLIVASTMMVIGVRAGANDVRAKATRNAIIIGVFILLAFVSAIRKGGGEKGIEDLSFGESMSVAVEHAFEGAYFLDPAKTAAIMDQTKQRDLWLNGSSFVSFIVTPVPRILWPEKPLIRIGPYVGQEVLQFDNNSGAPPGGVAELYMNFGWAGIVLGMSILGGLSALAYRRYLGADDRRFGRVQYALWMLAIILFLFGDFSLAMLYLIRFIVASYVCRHFWYKFAADPPETRADGKSVKPSRLPGKQVTGAPQPAFVQR